MTSPTWGGGGNLVRTAYNPAWGLAGLRWVSSADGEHECIFDLAAGFPGVVASTSLIESANMGRIAANEFNNGWHSGLFLDFNGGAGSEVRLVIYGGDSSMDDGTDWQIYFPFTIVTGFTNVIFNLMEIEVTSGDKGASGVWPIAGGPLKDIQRTQLSIPATGHLEGTGPVSTYRKTIQGLTAWLNQPDQLDYRRNEYEGGVDFINHIPLFLGEY